MPQTHRFELAVRWLGDRGTGTSGLRDFDRSVEVTAERHPALAGSAARAFRGDAARWNPEELLLAALAQCHLLAYLREAALAGIVVVGYRDAPELTLSLAGETGQVVDAVLRPEVTLANGDPVLATELHHRAAQKCFIARSVAFPVRLEPAIRHGRSVDPDAASSFPDERLA